MKFTYKEYMDKKGIKSRNTVKKYVRDGKIKEIKDEAGKLYIIDTQIDSIDYQFEVKNDNNDMVSLLKIEIDSKNKIINNLEQEIRILKLQLENKESFIKRIEEELKEDKISYQILLQQFGEVNKTYQLLLEDKREKQETKKWYKFWK